jgi:Putative amidase domain
VSQSTTDADNLAVTGLQDGSSYTISVIAGTTYGNSPATQVSVTPQSLSVGTASSAIKAAEDFVSAQQSLVAGTATTVDAADAAYTDANSLSSVLGAQAPGLEDQAAALSTQSESMAINSITFSGELAVQSGTTTTVYQTAAVAETTTTSDDSESGSLTQTNAFVFSSGATPVLQSVKDSTALAAPGATAGSVATSPSSDNPSADQQQDSLSIALTSGGGLVSSPPGAAQPDAASHGAVDYQGLANWALNNVYTAGNDGYKDDCTDFVSRAMHTGGDMPEKFGLDWRSDGNWYKDAYHKSYSWGGAYHLADFLWKGNNAQWLPYWNDGEPGDLIFFDWTGTSFGGISHSAVITKNHKGHIYITQHTENLKNYPLSTVSKENPKMTVWIADLTPTYYSTS